MNELSPDEVTRALEGLPGWGLFVSELPGKEPKQRTELKKTYEFASFEDAIEFMATAAERISIMDHHPRWENRWRIVTVWLSTWAIGHKPSSLDVELAKFMDNLYGSYAQRKG